jgi:hypothetical protein
MGFCLDSHQSHVKLKTGKMAHVKVRKHLIVTETAVTTLSAASESRSRRRYSIWWEIDRKFPGISDKRIVLRAGDVLGIVGELISVTSAIAARGVWRRDAGRRLGDAMFMEGLCLVNTIT